MSKKTITLPQKLSQGDDSSVFIVRDWNPYYDQELDSFVMNYNKKCSDENVILTIEEFEVDSYVYQDGEICLVEDGMSGINFLQTYRHITLPNDETIDCEIFATERDAVSFIQSIYAKNNKDFKSKDSFENSKIELPYDIGDTVYRLRDFNSYSDSYSSIRVYSNPNNNGEKYAIEPYKVEAIQITSLDEIILIEDGYDGFFAIDDGLTIDGDFRDEMIFTSEEDAVEFINSLKKEETIEDIIKDIVDMSEDMDIED